MTTLDVWDEAVERWGDRVMQSGYLRGHPIADVLHEGVVLDDDEEHWDHSTTYYVATGEPVGDIVSCAKCGLCSDADMTEPDPCIGMLPGVRFACCGHGVEGQAYVMLRDGTTFRGTCEAAS